MNNPILNIIITSMTIFAIRNNNYYIQILRINARVIMLLQTVYRYFWNIAISKNIRAVISLNDSQIPLYDVDVAYRITKYYVSEYQFSNNIIEQIETINIDSFHRCDLLRFR